MKLPASALAAALCAATISLAAPAAKGPPLAGVWNIAPTGHAASSGDLHFRVRQNDGSDPLDIKVPVSVGAKETTIARAIRDSLGSQLPPHRFKVELGQGANVLVSDSRGQPNFSLELVDSDIDELRVAVQSVTPAASPTVPQQEVPAVPPSSRSPDAPGAVNPAPGDVTPVPEPTGGTPDNSTPPAPDTSPPATPPPAAASHIAASHIAASNTPARNTAAGIAAEALISA